MPRSLVEPQTPWKSLLRVTTEAQFLWLKNVRNQRGLGHSEPSTFLEHKQRLRRHQGPRLRRPSDPHSEESDEDGQLGYRKLFKGQRSPQGARVAKHPVFSAGVPGGPVSSTSKRDVLIHQ